jgi:hypothetical protein
MKKLQFLNAIQEINEKQSSLVELKKKTISEYIESNKPCEKGQLVRIHLYGGRIVTGNAKRFGILENKCVYITEYTVGSNTKHITKPYIYLELL